MGADSPSGSSRWQTETACSMAETKTWCAVTQRRELVFDGIRARREISPAAHGTCLLNNQQETRKELRCV